MIITTHHHHPPKPFLVTAFYVVSILLLFAVVMTSIHADITTAPSAPIHDLMKKIHDDRAVQHALQEKLKNEPTTTVVDTHIQPDNVTITTKPTQEPVVKQHTVNDGTEPHRIDTNPIKPPTTPQQQQQQQQNDNVPAEQTNSPSALATHFHHFVSTLPKSSAFHNFSLWDQSYSKDPLDDDDLLGMLPDRDAPGHPHAFVSSTHFSMLHDPKKRRMIMRSIDIEAYDKDHYEKTTTYQVCYPHRAARDEKLVVKEQVVREDDTSEKNTSSNNNSDTTKKDDNNNDAANNKNNTVKRGIWYFQGPQAVKKQVDSGFKLAPFTTRVIQPFPFIFAPGPLLT